MQNGITKVDNGEPDITNIIMEDYINSFLLEPDNKIETDPDQPNTHKSYDEELENATIHNNTTLRRSNCVRRPT